MRSKNEITSSRRSVNDRAPVVLDVLFQPSGKPPRRGSLEDISAGGARILASKPCKEGDVVLVHLPWPSEDEPTTVTAMVRWSEQGRMGIQFSLSGASESDVVAKLRDAASSTTGARTEAGTEAGNEKKRRRLAQGEGDTPFSRDALLAATGSVHHMARRVRFQEVDAAGTIYYSRVFEYFGDVYVDLFERGGVSLPKAMIKREWAAPLVHAEAEYLAPMRFGDEVEVHVVKLRCGTSAATVGYRIASPSGRPLAVGHTVHVFVDGATFKPCPIPPDVLRALTADTEVT